MSRRCVNKEIVDFLEGEIEKEKRRNHPYRPQNYGKAKVAIQKETRVIRSKSDAIRVHGIGNTIGSLIGNFLKENPHVLRNKPRDRYPTQDGSTDEDEVHVPKKRKSAKPYIPRINSGGDAMLQTLYQHGTMKENRELSKKLLIELADPLCETSLVRVNNSRQYSGWNSMKTLRKHKLVETRKRNSKQMFWLTAKGVKTAKAAERAKRKVAGGDVSDTPEDEKFSDWEREKAEKERRAKMKKKKKKRKKKKKPTPVKKKKKKKAPKKSKREATMDYETVSNGEEDEVPVMEFKKFINFDLGNDLDSDSGSDSDVQLVAPIRKEKVVKKKKKKKARPVKRKRALNENQTPKDKMMSIESASPPRKRAKYSTTSSPDIYCSSYVDEEGETLLKKEGNNGRSAKWKFRNTATGEMEAMRSVVVIMNFNSVELPKSGRLGGLFEDDSSEKKKKKVVFPSNYEIEKSTVDVFELSVFVWVPEAECPELTVNLDKDMRRKITFDVPPSIAPAPTQPVRKHPNPPSPTMEVQQQQQKQQQRRRVQQLPSHQNRVLYNDFYSRVDKNVFLPMEKVQDVKSDEFEVVLLVDTRERAHNSRHEVIEKMSKSGIVCERYTLGVGDFAWGVRTKGSVEVEDMKVLDYVVERKAAGDFVSSIQGSRFQEQMDRLVKSQITHVFYVIEGDFRKDQFQNRDIKMLQKNCIKVIGGGRSNFRVQRTKNTQATLKFLKYLSLHIQSLIARKGVNSCLFGGTPVTLSNFTKMNRKDANLTQQEAFGRMLCTLNGVSPEVSHSIISRFPTPVALADEYAKKCKTDKDIVRMLTKVTIPSNVANLKKRNVGVNVSRFIGQAFHIE